MDARRLEEERVNEEVPPQVEQVEQVPQGAKEFKVLKMPKCLPKVILFLMWKEVLRFQRCQIEDLISIARAVTVKTNLNMMPRVVESTMTSRLRDFVRMNPPIFLGSKVGEDPQEFLDGVYKDLSAVEVTSREKAELDPYQLRDVSQIWYTLWKYNRPEG